MVFQLSRPVNRAGRKGFVTIDDDALMALTGTVFLSSVYLMFFWFSLGSHSLISEENNTIDSDNSGRMFFTASGQPINRKKRQYKKKNQKNFKKLTTFENRLGIRSKGKRRVGKRARHQAK